MCCRVAILLNWISVCAVATQDNSLQSKLQTVIDQYSDKGYAIGVGYVDTSGLDFGIGAGPRTPDGLPKKAKPGSLDANDTYVMGSGSKPFTATAVMRLVDEGKVSLDDKASTHVDGPMQKMWNTTLVKLFGPMAANVTVGHLIRMRSGLGDFDISQFDNTLLNATTVHNPLLELQFVASFKGKFGCRNPTNLQDYCTWVCAPGTCTSYSSVNFLLAGVVLLAHSAQSHATWQTYDMLSHLGPDFSGERYQDSHFPAVGPLSSKGLTAAGSCSRFTPDHSTIEMYSQDASTMGWCYGNTVASPWNVARFLFDLLLGHKFVSSASLAAMQKWSVLDVGWAAGSMQYGAGLQIRNVMPTHANPPKLTEVASFIGHDGVTFGFWSNQGVFPRLNASIALMTNQDNDGFVNYKITCQLVKTVAMHKGLKDDVDCDSSPGGAVYV